MSNSEIIIRLSISILLCGLIGLERKFYHKPAGFRTNILVGMGSTSLMLLTLNIFKDFNPDNYVDISRVVGQIITGIGFFGAGAIIQGRGSIHGFTTAAGIWVVAAIGIAVGLGYFSLAIFTTLGALIVLVILGRTEYYLEHRHDEKVSNSKPE